MIHRNLGLNEPLSRDIKALTVNPHQYIFTSAHQIHSRQQTGITRHLFPSFITNSSTIKQQLLLFSEQTRGVTVFNKSDSVTFMYNCYGIPGTSPDEIHSIQQTLSFDGIIFIKLSTVKFH